MSQRLRRLALPVFLAVLVSTPAAAVDQAAAERPGIDRAASVQASPAAQAALDRAIADPALRAIGRVEHRDARFALPTLLWATGNGVAPGRSAGVAVPPRRPVAADAARAHLGRIAPFYRLGRDDVRGAALRHVHDTGRGGVIATFRQEIDGIEVFRDEMKVMMDRDQGLVAVAGSLPGRALLGRGAARAFELTDAEALARALADFTGQAVGAGILRPAGAAAGGYRLYAVSTPLTALDSVDPLRVKPVWFHLPDALVPAYYLELVASENADAYVIDARDGAILFRKGLIVADAYTYRVWADASAPYRPWDGPQGTASTPHPSGLPDFFVPSMVAPGLVTLQNGPISTNDPWLAPGAVETRGNNVDAYADISSPDGFGAGDFRASTTAPGTFDRMYDVLLAPTSTTQRMASITQLFFVNNWLHDWYYDAGFDEAAGNAQESNLGRGGLEADRIRVEAQDYSGANNANMMTGADGAPPRMQMFVFNRTIGRVVVTAPASIAGAYEAGTAPFGPQSFDLSAPVARVVGDVCTPIGGSLAGKVALMDRGNSCSYVTKAALAEAAGAVGVLFIDSIDLFVPPAMAGSGSIGIPVLSVTQATAAAIEAQIGAGLSLTMKRNLQVARDGTIDDLIVAHEWGHYISNRLIGNGAGLSNNMGGGMGEGWADFHAMLLAVRPGENFGGAYTVGGYVMSDTTATTSAYYFGVRRYPYSVDMTKNPLTFRHIEHGVPLPVGPPRRGTSALNYAVHNLGEVWCSMLWECYAALLQDSGRLTFAEAQARMRDYLVAAYKMTPNAPTLLEARDAVLVAAAANDPADFAAFWAAFAKRGAGAGAVAPDRYDTENHGVVESFVVGADMAITDVALGEPTLSCDGDAYLDEGELAELAVTVRNAGATTLTATVVTVDCDDPAITFPGGNTIVIPATAALTSATVTLPVRLGAGAGALLTFHAEADDPALVVPGPRTWTSYAFAQVDEEPSATFESFDTVTDVWAYTGDTGPLLGWERVEFGPGDIRLFGANPSTQADASAMTPPMAIAGPANFRLILEHAYSFEYSYDGGVIELSTDDGANWTDLGPSITSGGYVTALQAGGPLAGRLAWTGESAGFPAMTTSIVNLGNTYAGQTVRVRFRKGTDYGAGLAGWSIGSLTIEGNQDPVFLGLVNDATPCALVAADEALPRELDFALAGANPVTGPARFRFALPQGGDVRVAVYDVAGRRVALLADGRYEAGVHTVAWDPRGAGARRSAGIYFARMIAGGRTLGQRVVVLD